MSELTQKDYIDIKGAREHNLKGIDVKIPRNKMVVLTGLSGSGKSSLAFDTIYAGRTAKVYGVVVFLCETVPWADGEAKRGEYFRTFPCYFH